MNTRRSICILSCNRRYTAAAEDINVRNVETNNINNKTNKLTNMYMDMEAEPANNSPKHIYVGKTWQ